MSNAQNIQQHSIDGLVLERRNSMAKAQNLDQHQKDALVLLYVRLKESHIVELQLHDK